MFKKILVANRGARALARTDAVRHIALARAACWAISPRSRNV
jgi:biotin carboxylase